MKFKLRKLNSYIKGIQKNPYDKPFLDSLIINHEVKLDQLYEGGPRYYLRYSAKLPNGKEIGYASIYNGDNFVAAVDVDKNYRLRGISTLLHNKIEKDLGIKLISGDFLEPDGKKFWKNRLKRNPPDPEILKNIRFEKTRDYNFEPGTFYLKYIIFHKGIPIGVAFIEPGDDFVSEINIKKEYQCKGIGTLLYNVIQKDLRITLRPIDLNKKFKGPYEPGQSEAGKMFWKKRLAVRK